MAGSIPLPKGNDRLFSNNHLRKQTRTNWSSRIDMGHLLDELLKDIVAFAASRINYAGSRVDQLAYVIGESMPMHIDDVDKSQLFLLRNYSVIVSPSLLVIGNEVEEITLVTLSSTQVAQLVDLLREGRTDSLICQLVALSIYATFFVDGGALLSRETLAITTGGIATYCIAKGVPIVFD